MICYYVVRTVKPGTVCSYHKGRTFLRRGVFTSQQKADEVVACWNSHSYPGVTYEVVACDDLTPVEEFANCGHVE